ncbi:arylsulfotransferase family protein [Georgenia wangjunii]|uniref:arylsulfotransferase family protein n=1 Tax=Georgenia wangjunii TaxID=3117730 RepID=UPI002F2670CD
MSPESSDAASPATGRQLDPDDEGRSRPGRRRARRLLVMAGGVAVLVAGALSYVELSRGGPAEPPVLAVDAASGGVSAFPVPGTAVIRPEAQLSFRGATDLDGIRIVGSESGEHTASVLAHSDGGGASLVPDEPFIEGETVTVSTGLDVRGADAGDYVLTVAELGERPDLEEPPVEELRGASPDPDGELAAGYVRQYASAPGIEPPQVDVTGPEAGTVAVGDERSPGVTAVGVKNGFGQKGPLLVDDAGEPVFFLPLTGVDARDVQVQTFRGEPVLTWWEGLMGTGYGYGEAVVMDTTYAEVARLTMVGGYAADSHEFRLTDDGTALLMAYEPVRMDLRDVGGDAEGEVIDNVVQEIDVATGALLYEWHSLGQVGIAETYLEPPEEGDRYDYFHANSIEVDDDGDLLVSARHTCAVYSLDRQTGTVEWRLGGRESDFAMGEGTTFLKQHDARRAEDGMITLFDNGGTCGDVTRELSRGIALDVDETAMTAELTREVIHPDEIFSESQASYTELTGGHVFFGWGSVPRFSLMDAGGQVLLDGEIPEDLTVTSYRAQRVEWVGRPTTGPRAVVVDGEEGAAVHVSWNGATEVASWHVVDGTGAEVAAADRTGFETTVPLPGTADAADLRVHAVAADGTLLGEGQVGPATGAVG